MSEAIRQGDIPGVQLRRRRTFPGVDAACLWSHLTEPDKLERWLADRAVVRSGPEGGLELVSGEGADEREVGETLEFAPPRRWTLAFRRVEWAAATRLELEISDAEAGAELSVLQGGFEHLPLSIGLTLWESYRRRWSAALERLEAVIG